MPVYNRVSPVNGISMAAREKVATGITDAYCNSTGAPRNFVHVFFREIADAGERFDRPFLIEGVNRAGRAANVVLALKKELRKALSEGAGVPIDQVGAQITETPAAWAMEGDDILPEPSQEDAKWFGAEESALTKRTWR